MQKTVNLYPARGLPGQEVNVHTAIYTPFNYLSDGTAAVGSFVFAKEVTSSTGAVIFKQASAKGTGQPLGFVERVLTGALGYKEDGTLVYAEGAELTIARRGDYYAANAGGAAVGKAVLCDPTTGKITYGEAGAANDTGWVVYAVGADESEPIIISNR